MAINPANNFDADIIVIGTSVATQTVIGQLKNSNLKILVLEGGDLDQTPFAQSLTFSDERGHYVNHHWGGHWLRSYGGASRVWNGFSAPLENWDLIGIDGRPKWPLSIDELEKYYRLSAPVMSEDPSVANLVKYNTAQEFVDRPYIIMESPLSYSDPKLLTANKNIELRLKHNVIKFTADDSGNFINGIWYSVEGDIRFAGIKKNTQIVLGAGGLGNAQVLLQPADNRRVPVGNESGLVGKTLMGHPHVPTGEAFVDPVVLKKPTWAQVKYKKWLPAYIIGADYKTKHNLLNASLSLTIAHDTELSPNEKAVKEFYEKKWGKKLVRQSLYARTEQLPNPDNRIEITAEKNAAGLHKLVTYCVFGARDMMGIDTIARMLATHWMKNQVGVATIDNDSIFLKIWGWAHPSGITRFGATPKDSVCDANGRVWAYQNLYINGSSLFPTVGYANPTWTIAALGMRLGDHLTRTMKKNA
jgi:choline dehydrogenase-like flavoprotein